MIDELRKKLDNKEITSEDLFKEAVSKAYKYQNDYNSFVTIMEEYYHENSSSPLDGIPYALKDNISTKGILTTGSSNILKDYVPVYDATVYKKLKQSGAVMVGKTVLDELAMGGTGTTGHTGIVRNPWDKTRMIGGSSAGSASSVALNIVPFSIGSDTGDSIRKPAAFGGVVGFKPTYGRVSRYGLFAFASSLDHVGCLSRSVKDIAYVTDVIKGHDEFDMTTLEDDNKKYVETLDNDIKGKKLFYIKEACNMDLYKNSNDQELIQTLNNFYETLEKLKEIGFIIEEVEFGKQLLDALYPTYMSISCAEATSNNANLTGIQFGPRGDGNSIEEIMFDSRTKGFSELIKRRFILGSYILQKENQEKLFLNACRVRRLVVDRMNELFKEYDGLIMPTSGGIAPKFGEKTDQLSDRYLILENHLVIGNFGGFPSISLPSGFINNMPISINLTGRIEEDDLVLNMAYKIEEKLGLKGLLKEEFKCTK
ncbi:MAG: aspartyl/glutamyl-tRNA amidotransferase subunit A [Clostridium sp.]|nr:aspartyl/glutamyl-tRNA amidotransferase subunit A [Clostridium sp.]MCM1444270.1 aspartyl/glutamyl-tRNA amidotransferase subunit A [Candidatus Amulumruptor caecigallinarius]